jgi:hypothetical protein
MKAVRSALGVALLLSGACGGSDASSPAPGSPPAAASAPAPAPLPPSSNPDANAVEAARPWLAACYDKARSANPALGHTTVTLSLRVDEVGHVSSVDLEYKHKLDDASKQCMRDAAFAIKLAPGQPRRVELSMPFGAR